MSSIPSTPLYHATVKGGLTGLAFSIGEHLYFTSMDDPRIYQVTTIAALTLQQPVEAAAAVWIEETILAPRLLAWAGGHAR